MRKLIMFIFFIISLVTIVALTISIDELISLFGVGSIDFESILELFNEASAKEIIVGVGMLFYVLFQIYGIPLIVFLVSYNGLYSKK